MRSLRFGVLKVWLVVGLLGLALAGGGLMLAGGPADPGEKKDEPPQAKADAKPEAAKTETAWAGAESPIREASAYDTSRSRCRACR